MFKAVHVADGLIVEPQAAVELDRPEQAAERGVPVEHDHATETFHVDGCYLSKRETLQTLNFRCGTPRGMPPTGSGVGKEISRRLHGAGKRMYRVDSSLAIANGNGDSMMNPDERARHPTVTL